MWSVFNNNDDDDDDNNNNDNNNNNNNDDDDENNNNNKSNNNFAWLLQNSKKITNFNLTLHKGQEDEVLFIEMYFNSFTSVILRVSKSDYSTKLYMVETDETVSSPAVQLKYFLLSCLL